jgi:hypothetical protein
MGAGEVGKAMTLGQPQHEMQGPQPFSGGWRIRYIAIDNDYVHR